MSAALLAAGTILILGGAALALLSGAAWRRERTLLADVLRPIAPTGRITTRDQLVALKRRLARIQWDEARMHEPRPLLRASARRVLETDEGFCGENARTAVKLLRLGGMDANRVYVLGERWGHVVVEHRWDGGWALFDGHADPRTALADDQVGRIAAEDLAAYPNRVVENPWRRSYRIPGLGRLPFGRAGRARPPAVVTALAETPSLLGLSAGLLLVLLGVAALASR